MAVKAFVFDCGGVLLRDRDESAYDHWEGRLGLAPGELRERLWAGEAWELAETGHLSEEAFWQRVGPELGLAEQEEISSLAQDLWGSWQVDHKVLSLIDALRARYRVAMLSNATDVLEEKLASLYGVADRFDPIVNSALVGIAKPDPEIYAVALRQLELEPKEVVFVDDRADNIAAAAALGLHVVWFVSADELERRLEVYLNHHLGWGVERGIGTEAPAGEQLKRKR